MHQQKLLGRSIELCSVGNKARVFFKTIKDLKVLGHAEHVGDAPTVESLIGVVRVMLDAFSSGSIDALYLCSNEFVNRMMQQPQHIQVLPIVPPEGDAKKHYWDYLYEPDAKEVLNLLLKRYIESQVYQGVVENIACEQAARMVAMKNATDNAKKIIEELQQAYNQARQASITQELSEIVAGAAAVN